MYTVNHLFYFTVLYLPIFYWAFYLQGFLKGVTKSSLEWLDKKISLDSERYTVQKFFYVILTVSVFSYMILGAVGAIFQTVIGFQEMYSLEDSGFISKVICSGFELVLLLSLLSFARMSEFIKPAFSFSRMVYKTQKNPRLYIKNLYWKYFGWHIVYVWLLLNAYYLIVGEFYILEGGKHFTLLFWFS